MADIDGDQERHKAALAQNSHHDRVCYYQGCISFSQGFSFSKPKPPDESDPVAKIPVPVYRRGSPEGGGCDDLIRFSAGDQVTQGLPYSPQATYTSVPFTEVNNMYQAVI